MNNVRSIIREIITLLEKNKNDSSMRWKIATRGLDSLHNFGESSIIELEKLLYSKSRKEILLSTLYLGLLQLIGMDAKWTSSSIIRITVPGDEELEFTSGVALAMLEHPKAVRAMKDHMRQLGEKSEKEWQKGGIATILKNIATGRF